METTSKTKVEKWKSSMIQHMRWIQALASPGEKSSNALLSVYPNSKGLNGCAGLILTGRTPGATLARKL